MNFNFHIPDWLADPLAAGGIGISGFIASKFIDSKNNARRESRTLSDSVLKLTVAVENAAGDMQGMKVEIHEQVLSLKQEIHNQIGGLREEIHDQVGGLRSEIKEARTEYRERLALMDQRINTVAVQNNQNKEHGGLFGL